MTARELVRLALPLIPTHGFTRSSLSLAAQSLPKPYELSDSTLTDLFGNEYEARRSLMRAWLQEGRADMSQTFQQEGSQPNDIHSALKSILKRRLNYNVPVLRHLPEAYALLATNNSSFLLDPRPAASHNFEVGDEALFLAGENTAGTIWYARRGAVALAYASAELHQINSPETTAAYLDSTLDALHESENKLKSVGEFLGFVGRSWQGLAKSRPLW